MASHMQIAHRWAQRDENLKIKGYAIFAEGLKIFSYGHHFCIAEHFQSPRDGSWAIWFNTNGYSISTSKHKSYVDRAIAGDATVFCLPENLWIQDFASNRYLGDKQKRDAAQAALRNALDWYEAQALESFKKASRARTNVDYLTDQANGFLAQAGKLAEFFEARYTAPDFAELSAKAERRAIAQRKEAAKAAKAREKQQREAYAKALEKWNAGDRADYGLRDLDGSALVRRSSDGETLETSQGASVPWRHAVAIFHKVKQCRDTATSWQSNGETLRAGHFQIDWIDTGGNMKAGCHAFTWKNMEALAIAEGVFETEPA